MRVLSTILLINIYSFLNIANKQMENMCIRSDILQIPATLLLIR